MDAGLILSYEDRPSARHTKTPKVYLSATEGICGIVAPFKDGSFDVVCKCKQGHEGAHYGVGAGYNHTIFEWGGGCG